MDYIQATLGRIFLVHFKHDDILHKELNTFIRKTKLKTAFFLLIGALKKGRLGQKIGHKYSIKINDYRYIAWPDPKRK